MTDDADDYKVLIRKINLQEKQIDQLREKVFALQESLLHTHSPTCDLEHSLAPITPIISRVFPDARTTVIAFGGMLTRLGMPPAEFLKTFMVKNMNTVFVKDFKQCWYQQGLLALSNNTRSSVELIKKQIPSRQEKVYTIGTSAGGFAAILFGVLLDVDKVIVFGPQTIVTKQVFQRFKGVDSRIADINFADELLDLKKLLETTQYKGSIHIHFANSNRIDRIAAERLKDFEQVHLHPWETNAHNVAGWLKKENKLESILSELFPDN